MPEWLALEHEISLLDDVLHHAGELGHTCSLSDFSKCLDHCPAQLVLLVQFESRAKCAVKKCDVGFPGTGASRWWRVHSPVAPGAVEYRVESLTPRSLGDYSKSKAKIIHNGI